MNGITYIQVSPYTSIYRSIDEPHHVDYRLDNEEPAPRPWLVVPVLLQCVDARLLHAETPEQQVRRQQLESLLASAAKMVPVAQQGLVAGPQTNTLPALSLAQTLTTPQVVLRRVPFVTEAWQYHHKVAHILAEVVMASCKLVKPT